MAARRSIAQSLPAIRAASPRTALPSVTSRVAASPASRPLSTSSLSTPAMASSRNSSSPSYAATRRLHATARQLTPATTSAATTATEYPTNHSAIAKPIDTANFIDNEFVPSNGTKWIDLHDPADRKSVV